MRYFKRKRSISRRRYGKRKGKWARKGSYKRRRLTKIIKRVARNDLEKHRCYYYYNAITLGTTAGSQYMNGFTSSAATAIYPLTRDEGGAISNGKTRTGSKIYIKEFSIKGSFLQNSSASSSVCRILIFRQLVGGQISSADILATADSNALAVYAPYNRDNAGTKFEILYDRLYFTGSVNNNVPIRIRMRNLGEVTYTGPNATDYNKGMICTLMLSDRVTFPTVIYGEQMAVIIDI